MDVVLLPFGNDNWFSCPFPSFFGVSVFCKGNVQKISSSSLMWDLLVFFVLFYFFKVGAIPAYETKLSQALGLGIKCWWVGGSTHASQLRCEHLRKKPAHLRVEEVHGTLWRPQAQLHTRDTWEWILCWTATKAAAPKATSAKKMSKSGNKLRFKQIFCVYSQNSHIFWA